MGLNSLLNFFKLDGMDDDYEDYEYDAYEEEEAPAVSKKALAIGKRLLHERLMRSLPNQEMDF